MPPRCQYLRQAFTLKQGFGGSRIPLADGIEPGVETVVVLLRQRNQIQQGIRHAAHRRDDNADTGITIIQQNTRDTSKTIGIGQARAAKLVNLPGCLAHAPLRP